MPFSFRLGARAQPVLSAIVPDGPGSELTAASLQQAAPGASDVEILVGPPVEKLESAAGRYVCILEPGSIVDRAYAASIIAASRSSRVLVPGAADPHADEAALRERAAIGRGVAVRARAARRAGWDAALGDGAAALHRAKVIAAEPSVPTALAAPEPSAPPASAAGARQVALALVRTIVEVDALRSTSPKASIGGLNAIKRDLAVRIGRTIAADPGIRPEVVRAIDASGTSGFSFRAMNIESASELAIVYAFPPYLDTGGFVASRRLADDAVAYDVVTQDMSGRRPRDERSLALANRNLGRRMVVRAPISSGNWPHVEEFCRKGMTMVEEREAIAGRYRNLYTRSMWAAPSVLGAWYKSRNLDTPWTAEFSDPLTLRPNGDTRPNIMPANAVVAEVNEAIALRGLPVWPGELFFEAIEWIVFALADRIFFTNENQRALMLSHFPNRELAERAHAISEIHPHPVPDPSFYDMGRALPALPEASVRIGYFGNFYNVRGVGDILDPFALLTPAERARVRLMIFTAAVDTTREAVAAHPAADCATVMPALAYFDFLALTKQMDWLLIADAHTPPEFGANPYLPSKLADYRGSATPIWGIVDAGSTLSRTSLEATSPLGDPGAGAAVLRRILSGR